jgi:hypothetical protein
MTNTSFQTGDYVQATKSLKKIFCVKEVSNKGLILERASRKTGQSAFFPWEAINYPTAFFQADQTDPEIAEIIATYEINKAIENESFEEMCSYF